MPRQPRVIMEFRAYDLPPHFPLMILTGEEWRISDVPSGVLHFHNCLEIGLCYSDSGILGFQDGETEFHAGDVAIISGDMPHTTYSAPGTASRWSYIYMDVDELMRPLLPLEAIPYYDKLQKLLYNTHLIFHAGEYPMLRNLLESILEEAIHKRPGYESSIRGLVLAVLVLLTRENVAEADGQPDAMPIAPAIKHINEHYMDDFSIGELAALCHLSPSHFRRIFREIMGVGPLEHLNRTRIMKACSLLRMSDASVMAICGAVGFTSLSSFNRHFVATTGSSPTEWRRSMNAMLPVTVHKYAGWLVPPKD
ncbi:MAG: helix-turn-helix transcriptional regulator [Clostridia bacterium]|nr:helix-turn-helix transcriptional regulator [Clostridia bacterium]